MGDSMSSVVISGDTSGAITLAAPSVAGTNTATLPAATGTVMVSGNMPAFSAYYVGSSQTPAANTWTKIIFNTKNFDTNTNFDATTNYRFTPTVAGYYQINLICGIGQNGSLNTTYYASIYKNGTGYSYSINNTASGAYSNNSMNALIYFNGTTDYVEAYVNCTNQGFYAGASNSGFMMLSGSMVRAA